MELTTQNSARSSMLWQSLSQNAKYGIISGFWGLNFGDSDTKPDKSENYSSYFTYYTQQSNTAFHDNGRHLSVKTHEDIIEIASEINSGSKREDIKLWLSSKMPDPKPENTDELIDASIDLTVRLLTMMDVGDLKFGFSGQNQLVWSEGSLEEWVHGYFEAPQVLENEYVKLESIFNARNLVRIAGFEIHWTNNLADHLRIMNEDDRKIAIFHNVTFLEAQRKSAMFPTGLIDETIRTLALFLPQSDPLTRKWFRKLSLTSDLDERAAHCARLKAADRHIDNFAFWRDRIVVLKQIFDEAEPSTLSQWWHDRRNGVQWYTFWVAIVVLILTLIFGLVQCIEGGIQAHAVLSPTT